ncbi:MAG: SufD family Fe-S cluster assembly protein, partial [Parachlamydiaceae bacterium]
MNEQLSALFEAQEKNGLFKFKQKIWDRFRDVGLPGPKNETYQYVRLRKLFEKPLLQAANKTPVYKENTIVIGEGYVTYPDIQGVTILPLREAEKEFSTLLQNQYGRFIREEKDPFALLNGALSLEGVLIYVAPKTKLQKPITIEYAASDNAFFLPKAHLFFGKGSEAKIIEHNSRKKGIINAYVEFNLEEGAIVEYTQLALDNEGWVFDFTRVLMKETSRFTAHLVTNGSETVRYDYGVQLKGEGGIAHLNGLWMLNEAKEAHVHVLMEHQAPY